MWLHDDCTPGFGAHGEQGVHRELGEHSVMSKGSRHHNTGIDTETILPIIHERTIVSLRSPYHIR